MENLINPTKHNQLYLYWLGLSFMVLNKVRHSIMGYKTPRTFSTNEIERSVDYCIEVVNNHESHLQKYTGSGNPFAGKKVFEIGPGPDLGTAFCIIAKGAESYTALDKNKLISQTSEVFYEILLKKLHDFPAYNSALNAYEKFKRQDKTRQEKRREDKTIIKYIHDPDFMLNQIPLGSFDIFITQAVLEHFDDVECTFQKVKEKMKPNGVLSNLVDAASHTRYIKDIDPCNLLRYSDFIYNVLKFDGSPNRLRASQYAEIFKKLEYDNINIVPNRVLDTEYVKELKGHISAKFKHDDSLKLLSFYILATA